MLASSSSRDKDVASGAIGQHSHRLKRTCTAADGPTSSVTVYVPDDVAAGQQIRVQWDGQQVIETVPAGYAPGDLLEVKILQKRRFCEAVELVEAKRASAEKRECGSVEELFVRVNQAKAACCLSAVAGAGVGAGSCTGGLGLPSAEDVCPS
eukprot:SAG22_NODE_11436_length_485_cov_0.764249_1_plen_151_part_10